MWKCDLNKVGFQLYCTRTSVLVFSCIFAAYLLRNKLFEEHLWETVPEFVISQN